MADDLSDSLSYITNLLQGILDKNTEINPISETAFQKLVDNFSTQVGELKNSGKITEKELKNVMEYFRTFISSYDLSSKKFDKMLSQLQHALETQIKGGKNVDVDKLLKALTNMFSSALINSAKAEQRGSKNGIFKGVLDNEKLDKIYQDLAKNMGASLDSTATKLMAFFKEEEKQKEKKTRKFMDDLIEGLEKSKWVGGALRDTFALIGLLGANWLSHFGKFGRILGASFYVAMTTAGPILVNMLLKGIGSLFTKVIPSMFKGLGGALVRMSTNVGGPLSMFSPGRWNMMSTAGKVGSVGRLAGAAAGSLALGAGAIWAGKESVDSFKKGDKVGGGAFGIGALGLGVAAIAALVAGIAAPVTIIAAVVGGIAVGVGALWKNREKILEHFKKNKGFYDKVLKFLDLVFPVFGVLRRSIEWLVEHWPWGGGDKGNGEENGVGGGAGNLLGAQDKTAIKKIGSLGINKYGQMTNLKDLTQDEASKAIQEFMNGDSKDLFYSNYEILDSSYADFGQFHNDAVIKDSKGNIIGVPVAKGTKAKIDKYRADMRKEGISESAIAQMKVTSGMGTKDSITNKIHAQGALGMDAYTHYDIAGRNIDIGLPAAYAQQMYEIIRRDSEDMGMDAFWEGGSKSAGDFYYKKAYQGGLSNAHIDLKIKRGQNKISKEASDNAEVYENQKKVYAEQHSIAVSKIAEQLEQDIYENGQKVRGTENLKVRNMEVDLRDRGYFTEVHNGSEYWFKKVKQKDGTEEIYQVMKKDPDVTGNDECNDVILNLVKISNRGVQ